MCMWVTRFLLPACFETPQCNCRVSVKFMSNPFWKPTMSVVGRGATALGGRGLLVWQRQHKFMMVTKCFFLPVPVTVRSRLLNLHWPLGAWSSKGILWQHFPNTLQCSVQDSVPPATDFVLLNTKEYADGSILFNFGTSEQETAGKTSQEIFKVANGPCNSGKESEDTADQPAQFNRLSKDALEKTKSNSQAELKETSVEDSEDVDGISDPATLTCITYDAENIAQELNKKDDKKNLLKSGSSNGELLSKGIEKATLNVKGASYFSTSTATNGNESSRLGFRIIPVSSYCPLGQDTIFDVRLFEARALREKSHLPVLKDQNTKQGFVFKSAGAMTPHPDKVKTGGEDAYFIDGAHWVGVADGVGGWALSGINAGHYARELMWNCAERARKMGSASDPKSVLVYAAKRTKAKGTAATLVASLYNQTLRVANIGDSGFIVVRDTVVVARSQPMVRGFNFPYQIGTEGDDPEIAEVYDFHVEKDDVVILGSDGIFDNLFEEQCTALVDSVQKNGGGPEVVAKELVKLAQKIGATKEGASPFAAAAHGAGYGSYFGGKLDDTTAVVAYVT